MKVVTDLFSLREMARSLPEPFIFVPTMGALHEGHRALIQKAREVVGPEGSVVVTIFVNPIQFDRSEDLTHYPRPIEADHLLCRENGVDLLYEPTAQKVYAPNHSVRVTESKLSQTLCGASRPGHFDGVCTIVLKLYHSLQPRYMVFGEKDFQQLAVLRRMVRDLDLPLTLIAVPTVRAPSGLALSSRNARLSEMALKEASTLYPFLQQAALELRRGVPVEQIQDDLHRHLSSLSSEPTLDYCALVDAQTLEPRQTPTGPALLAVAIFFEGVRLIDHITVDRFKEASE